MALLELLLIGGAAAGVYAVAKSDAPVIKQGVTGVPDKPNAPRAPVPENVWGTAHDVAIEVRTESMVSSDPSDLEGHGDTRPPPPLHSTAFAVPLDKPRASSIYRVNVLVIDRDALQARTTIQWPDGYSHADNPNKLFPSYYPDKASWRIGESRASTCYAERLQRQIDVIQGVVGAGEYQTRNPLPCPGSKTPPQTYTIGQGQDPQHPSGTQARYFASVGPYSKSERIPYGDAYVRQHALRLDVVNGSVTVVGKVAPSIAALVLDVRVRWWRVDA